jgi:hypothetical protein
VNVTNLRVLLRQSHDYVFYVSRTTLEPPQFCPQKHSDLDGQDFAHFRELLDQPRLAELTCALSWSIFEINPALKPITDGVYFNPNLRNAFFSLLYFVGLN